MDRYLVVGAVVLSLLLSSGACERQEPEGRGEEVLAQRRTEPRLSTQREHSPCTVRPEPGRSLPSVTCGPPSPRLPVPRGSAGADGPEGEHRSALRLLVHGRGGGLAGPAVERLRSAVAARPGEAHWHSDLAAAFFLRAHAEQRPADLVLALDAAGRALALDPSLEPALFNRALVLERLHLCRAARTGWEDYLARDPASGWGREARERRQHLECEPAGDARPAEIEDLLAERPSVALDRTLGEALPAWADAVLEGDEETARHRLERLRRLGAALHRQSGDASVLREVADLDLSGGAALRRRARGWQAYREASRLLAASRYGEAEAHYQRARALAGDAGSTLALWSGNGLLVSRETAGDHGRVRRELAALRDSADLDDLPGLRARLAWTEGLMQIRTGAFADSRRSFQAAARLYERMGDPFRRAGAEALAAETLHALGLSEPAWESRHRALGTLGRHPSGSLHNLLFEAAIAARQEGLLHAGLELQTAGLETARSLGSASRTVEALLGRSRIEGEMGRSRDALADLDQALELAAGLPDPAVRERLTADVHEARGALLLESDPAAAVAALSAALPLYRETGFSWKLPGVLLHRARALRSLDREAEAEADLAAALSEFRRRDRTLPPEVFRHSHHERAQEIFEEMIRLQLERGRSDRALLYAEAARRLRERGGRGTGGTSHDEPAGGAPTEPEEALRQRMASVPAGTAVVELAVVGDQLLTWVVHGGEIRFLQRPEGNLEERVAEYAGAVARPGTPRSELEALAGRLHADLVVPWIRDLPPGTRLVFVPDRYLHRLPWAALRDGRTGRWLGFDHIVSTAPSLAFAVAAGESRTAADRAGETAPGDGSAGGGGVLLVGDPRPDPDEAGFLPPLPGAAEEVERIAALYGDSTVLTGREATRAAFVAAFEKADVVHYAGHGLLNPRDPWVSYLPLAPSADGGSGLLLAREIHGLEYRRRLVVLSACGSGSDGRLRSAGFPALVSAFLNAGADAVVSSLWAVEDRAVLPLSVDLHRGLAAGLPPAEALHEARLRYVESFPEATPHHWASLQTTGVADPDPIHRRTRNEARKEPQWEP